MALHSFWVIVDGQTPTSFRSRQQEDLLPTLTQLKRTQPDVRLMWFERGRLWASPEDAKAALIERRKAPGRRPREWRPGGDHVDPKAKYDIPRDERRARFKARHERDRRDGGRDHSAGGDDRPFRPKGDRPFTPRGDRPFRPDGDRKFRPEGDRPFRPKGDRPFTPRGDRPFRPDGDRKFRPEGDRPFRPKGDRPFKPRGDRPFRPDGDRKFRPRDEGRGAWRRDDRPRDDRPRSFGDRPWRPKKPGQAGKPWQAGRPWKPKKPKGDKDDN